MNVEQGLGLHQLLGLTQLLNRQHLARFCWITDSCKLLTTVKLKQKLTRWFAHLFSSGAGCDLQRPLLHITDQNM